MHRDEQKAKLQGVRKVADACPICGSDVYGSRSAKYFCRNCFVLFTGCQLIRPRSEMLDRFDCRKAKNKQGC